MSNEDQATIDARILKAAKEFAAAQHVLDVLNEKRKQNRLDEVALNAEHLTAYDRFKQAQADLQNAAKNKPSTPPEIL